MEQIEYKAGFKYQLFAPYEIQTYIYPAENIAVPFVVMEETGKLWIQAGYCWDGPSGPTYDSKNFMRGSLVHDVLYQLIRMEKLKHSDRKAADQLLRDICREDGMTSFRSWYVYRAVRRAGFLAAYGKPKEVISAP
jgi:hypothetical protein